MSPDVEIAAILTRAAWRVRRGYTTGCLARDEDGNPVAPTSLDAVAWSAAGAIAAEASCPDEARAAVRRAAATLNLRTADLALWNDRDALDEEHVAAVLEDAADRATADSCPAGDRADIGSPPRPTSHGARVERRSAQGDPLAERPSTLSFAQAAREYGLQPDDVRALVGAGIAWTVTPPGRSRPRVVRDGLETWVAHGRPPAGRPARRSVYLMPKALSPPGGRRG